MDSLHREAGKSVSRSAAEKNDEPRIHMCMIINGETEAVMNENRIHCDGITDAEPYMNEHHLVYFQEKLLGIIHQMSEKIENTRREMQQGKCMGADVADRSGLETWRENLLMNFQHCHKIILQSEAALARIRNKTFGYCVLTGTEIGLQRLEIIPYAHLSVDAQEIFENNVNSGCGSYQGAER